jgi:hypothetical protein
MWNNTIGPLTNRPGRPGTWGYENTDGLGLVEYLNVSAPIPNPILTFKLKPNSCAPTSTWNLFSQSGQECT